MTDKAQAMMNELVDACIAFGRGVEPDWQTRIDKAQRELREYIAELEAERKRLPEVYDETKWKENLIRVRELFADRFGDVDVEQFFQKIRSESYPGSTKGG